MGEAALDALEGRQCRSGGLDVEAQDVGRGDGGGGVEHVVAAGVGLDRYLDVAVLGRADREVALDALRGLRRAGVGELGSARVVGHAVEGHVGV